MTAHGDGLWARTASTLGSTIFPWPASDQVWCLQVLPPAYSLSSLHHTLLPTPPHKVESTHFSSFTSGLAVTYSDQQNETKVTLWQCQTLPFKGLVAFIFTVLVHSCQAVRKSLSGRREGIQRTREPWPTAGTGRRCEWGAGPPGLVKLSNS